MDKPNIQVFVTRLDKLERENRRLKLIGTIALIGIMSVVMMGQATTKKVPTVIEAERFVVRDRSGRERIILGDDMPARVKLVPGSDNYGIAISNDFKWLGKEFAGFRAMRLTGHGLELVQFNRSADDSGILREGGISGRVTIEPKGLYLFGEDLLKSRAYLGMTKIGQPTFVLSDAAGKDRAVIGSAELETAQTGELTTQPESSIVLLGKDGKVFWKLP
jgi:hypothetical protein